MRHVIGLVQQLGDAEIPYFDFIIFAQEHIDCFDISMKDLERMQIV